MSKGLAHEIIVDIKRVAYTLGRTPSRDQYTQMGVFSKQQIDEVFGNWTAAIQAAGHHTKGNGIPLEKREPRMLVLDIECLPKVGYFWDVWDQNIYPPQIIQETTLASVAVMWINDTEVMYMDQSDSADLRDDRALCEWTMEHVRKADVLITQNGKRFDHPVLNTRFIKNGLGPLPPYKHGDTKIMAKRHFKFSHNSLEGLCKELNTEFKKLTERRFGGWEGVIQLLARNKEAWEENKLYNCRDVLATKGAFLKMLPWGIPGVNLNVYRGDAVFSCHCGSTDLVEVPDEYYFTNSGQFRRYRCNTCNAWVFEKGGERNLLHPMKKDSLKGK